MSSFKVLMYSFKGGAGRTVSTANIASVLAVEYGKRVVVIDLDVESAGSSVLFEVDDKVEKEDCWTIQDVLRGFYETREGARETINLNIAGFEKRLWPRLHLHVWPGMPGWPSADGNASSYLKVIPARRILRSTEEVSGGASVLDIFDQLLVKLDTMPSGPDFIFFDSASGLQNTAMMAFGRSDVLMMFARWSRQFIKGSIQFITEQICPQVGGQLDRVFVVPTAVPNNAPSGTLEIELTKRRSDLHNSVWHANRLASQIHDRDEPWVSILDPILEADGLKWDEKIVVRYPAATIAEYGLGGALTDYRRLAGELVKLKEMQEESVRSVVA